MTVHLQLVTGGVTHIPNVRAIRDAISGGLELERIGETVTYHCDEVTHIAISMHGQAVALAIGAAGKQVS